MTRFARKGPANKKKPLPASNWEDFADINKNDATDDKSEEPKLKKRKRDASASEDSTAKTSKVSGDSTTKSSKASGDSTTKTSKGSSQKPSSSSTSLSYFMETDIASSLENSGLDKSNEKKIEAEEKEEVLHEELKKATRSEKRRMKRIETRQSQKVCFNCRKPGHELINCPEVEKLQRGVDICFRCGSGEHKITQCKSKNFPKGKFPYANCFICGESGHLSRDCPENRNGVYPHGGCCLSCGSIYHFKRDCPELKAEKDVGRLCLKTADKCTSLDEDPTVETTRKCKEQEKKPQIIRTKVVKF